MNAETVFSIASAVAVVGWIALWFAPNTRFTEKSVHRAWIPIGLSALYLVAISIAMATGPQGGGFGSIAEVRMLFSNDWGLLAGWIHYLAFDLYIGGALSLAMRDRGYPPYVRVPILFLVFMFGPVGFLVFHLTRLGAKK